MLDYKIICEDPSQLRMIDIHTIFREDLKNCEREKLEALAVVAIAQDVSKNFSSIEEGLKEYDKYLNGD